MTAPLPPDEVHVWQAALDRPAADLARLAAWLAPDELERAARFKFDEPRRRFVAARGALRGVLAAYLGCPPQELHFAYGPHGKPALGGNAGLEFNLAHSGELALIAVAAGRRVGVDLERVRPIPDAPAIAASFFTPREAAALAALSPERRTAAFFAIWTRKEACLKALGAGFALSPQRFEVGLPPDAAPCLISLTDGPEPAGPWKLEAWAPRPGWIAALAAAGEDWRLVVREYGG